VQEHFHAFYNEFFNTLSDDFGPIKEIHTCDNLSEHLIGNTYVKFKDEDDAKECVEAMQNRWFDGKPIQAALSPVTDFREACCRQFDQGECTRGGFCNFMHLKPISESIINRCKTRQRAIRHILRSTKSKISSEHRNDHHHNGHSERRRDRSRERNKKYSRS
ncbi:MAG: Splicing factor U2AF 26 kDa subunit, partial [Paramarteilia canceri]